MATGLWTVGGINLPDFNISEKLGLSKVGIPDNPGLQTGVVYGDQLNAQSQPLNTSMFGPLQTQQVSTSNGQVLGTNTTAAPTANTSTGASGNYPVPAGPAQNPTEVYNQQMRQSIGAGWDEYTKQLNDMLNVGIPGQQQAQQQIAQTAYNQGLNTLGSQKQTQEQQLAQQQKTSLRDLGDNVKNLFASGNTYLGARGAGDSSAANQYSYAIAKMGTRERANIMNQVQQRQQQIGDIYNQESNRLKSDLDTKTASIAQWFNDAQNQLRQQIGQAGLNKQKDIQALSQQIYSQAINAYQQLQNETKNRQSMLEQWALNNSKTVQEAVANMQSLSSIPQFQGLGQQLPQGSMEGQVAAPIGFGATGSTQKRDIFGNIIQ